MTLFKYNFHAYLYAVFQCIIIRVDNRGSSMFTPTNGQKPYSIRVDDVFLNDDLEGEKRYV